MTIEIFTSFTKNVKWKKKKKKKKKTKPFLKKKIKKKKKKKKKVYAFLIKNAFVCMLD